MINYHFKVRYSSNFKKSLKKMTKQGKDIEKFLDVVDKLAVITVSDDGSSTGVLKEELEEKYKNHNLIDNKYYKNCGECHIESDWLLIYKYYDEELVLLLVDTGNHSNLF